MYSTTTHQIDCPDEIWEEFKQIHTERDRLNGPIVELIADNVREHRSGDLDPQVRREISRVLGGDE